MLTIGYDASVTLVTRTGIGRFVLELLRELVATAPQRARLVVLLNSARHSPGPEHEFLFTNPVVQPVRRRFPGPRVVRGWASIGAPSFELLAGPRCDVVHAPAGYLPPTSAPLVATIHDAAFLRDPVASLEPLGGALFRDSWPKLLPRAAAIATDSEFVRRDLLASYPQLSPARLTTIHAGADHLPPAEVRPGNQAPYLLAVTAEEARKRIDLLLEAWTRARAKLGSDGPRLRILGMGRERLLPEGADRLEAVNDSELARLYAGASATILTSREEGFGFPLLEAMAAGCPVVCGRNSSLAEIGAGAAMLVEPETPEAFAEAIVQAARATTDAAQRSQLRSHAAKFTWNSAALAYWDLYRGVTGKK